MRMTLSFVILAALALTQAGCAAGFHAGGRSGGVGGGASFGAEPPIVITPQR